MKGVYNVWKDLLQDILDHADIAVLEAARKGIPSLYRAAQEDPTAFYRHAFSVYFGEYMAFAEETAAHYNGDDFWRKMALWMTWAHRFVLKELELTRGTLFRFIARFGEGVNRRKDYSHVHVDGKRYRVVDFVRNVMNIESGQLLDMCSPLKGNGREARVYWTSPFSLFCDTYSDGSYVHSMLHGGIVAKGTVTDGDTPGGVLFLSTLMRNLYNPFGPQHVAEMLATLPDEPMQKGAIFLGTCVACLRKASFACSGCGEQQYCSVECQARDWDAHSATCAHD